jgi:hypothetical protein
MQRVGIYILIALIATLPAIGLYGQVHRGAGQERATLSGEDSGDPLLSRPAAPSAPRLFGSFQRLFVSAIESVAIDSANAKEFVTHALQRAVHPLVPRGILVLRI